MLQHALHEFGRRMGLPMLELSDQQVVGLEVQGLGLLYLEQGKTPAGGGAKDDAARTLHIYLLHPLERHDDATLGKALALCHYEHGHSLPLVAGVQGEQLMLLTRLPEREVTAASLEMAVVFLRDMLHRLREQ